MANRLSSQHLWWGRTAFSAMDHAGWCGGPANYSAVDSLGTTFGGDHFTAWLTSLSSDFILSVPVTGNSFTDTSVGSMWRWSPSLSRLSQPLWQNLAFFDDLYAYRTAEVFGCSWHVRNNSHGCTTPICTQNNNVSGEWAHLISGTGRDGTGRFRKMRVPNFRNAGTVTEIPTSLKSGITENLTCLKSGITEILTCLKSGITENLWSGVMKTESRGQACQAPRSRRIDSVSTGLKRSKASKMLLHCIV